MNKHIDYKKILDNIEISINAMEYDCLRSAGKAKFNAGTLNELYKLQDRLKIKVMVPTSKPAPKLTTPKKEK